MADENWMEDMLEVDAPRAVNVIDFRRPADDLIEDDAFEDHSHLFTKLSIGGADGKQVLGNAYNVGLILEADYRVRDLVAYDEFRERPVILRDIDTGVSCVPTVRVKAGGEPLASHHLDALMAFMQAPSDRRGHSGGHGCGVTKAALETGVSNAARRNAFDPVKDMIESVEWDGVSRIGDWLSRYLGCPRDIYHEEVGTKWLVGAVARVYEPGTKFDYVMTIGGAQGARKSTMLEILGGEFFTALAAGAMKDEKRLIEATQGSWIVEIAEMAAMQGASQSSVKNIVSTTVDRARLAYDKLASDHRRRFVFAATTNETAILDDPTGGRRYWIVDCKVPLIDTEALELEVAQMWSEALHVYRAMRSEKPTGHLPLFLSPQAAAIAEAKQAAARAHDDIDAIADEIRRVMETPRLDGEENAFGASYYAEYAPKEIFAEVTGKPAAEYTSGKVARDFLKACRRVEYLATPGERKYIKRLKEKAKPVVVIREKFLPHFAARLSEIENVDISKYDANGEEVRAGAGEREEKMGGRGGSDIVDGILDL